MSDTPFHSGELAAQALAGGGAGGAGIRAFMPDQHRTFFALLPYLFVGTADGEGWPLATMLTGEPGFVTSPDDVTLHIAAQPDHDDPAAPWLVTGSEIGLLGIDLSTRRRNRANGILAARDATGLTVAVTQSFGNCPQYIQLRAVEPAARLRSVRTETFAGLDEEARAMIARADTFFVASRSGAQGGGADISHRGGKPGFVQVQGDTLRIPDFRGNRYFNTLGNLLEEPRASLLLVDFASGDVLQLQGRAEIDWNEAGARVAGAERSWTFTTVRGWRRRAAAPLRWSFLEFSPHLERTGTWG